jgi:hypothetical protein
VQFCYLDESGGCEDPASGPSATPVMVILGLIVDGAAVPALTREFLALLTEVKGSEILQMTRSSSRNQRRQAQRFRGQLLDLVEAHACRLVGRVWIKEPGKSMIPDSVYGYSVQDIARHFSESMESSAEVGVIIADGRSHHTNLRVAHSIFTQKWRTGGDPYASLREVPLFAASDNHAGLQITDLLASTLAFPMAASAYCPARAGNVHCSARYREVRQDFGSRLRALQYRYRDESGLWRGGLVVSDPLNHRSGAALFSP